MPDKTLNEVFTDIADAIRAKTESQETMTPLEMADNITHIPTGQSYEFITDNGSHFAYFENDEHAVLNVQFDDIKFLYNPQYDGGSVGLAQVSVHGWSDTNVYRWDSNDYSMQVMGGLYNYGVYEYDGDHSFSQLSSDTLYYIDDYNDPYWINLTAGSTYQYDGGSDFYLVGGLPQGTYWVYYACIWRQAVSACC